jgi:hypothetical protein
MTRTITLALCLTSLLSCAPDLRVDHPFDGQVSTGPLVTTEVMTGTVKLMYVDATSKGSQVFVDLDVGEELKAEQAFSTNAWDLAFKRFEITMNGGAGSPGTVEVAVLKGQDFDALDQAPATGYQQDGSTSVFNGVEGGWYFYDLGVHRLVTREELVYVVKTTSGAYFKLKLLNYYDMAGTPAAISLEYGPLAPP